MITELLVRNYILIPELKLEFGPGMSVLTGETGAGKSIIVGALNLIFGKSSTQQIAHNPALDVYLEITFSYEQENTELCAFLEELGADTQTGELIIAREFNVSGKSVSYLNGRKTAISVLKDLHYLLIDFHHQRDQQKLLSPAYQLDLLDQYGNLLSFRQEFKQCLAELKDKLIALQKLTAEDERSKQLGELYRFQLDELRSAGLIKDEDNALQQEFELLSHSEEIISLSQNLYESLYESENSVYDSVNRAFGNLNRYNELSSRIDDICFKLSGVAEVILDVSRQISSLSEKIASDPARLEDIKYRLDLINSLKTKYKLSTLEQLTEYQQKISQCLLTQETNVEAIMALTLQINADFAKLLQLGDNLTQRRRTAALRLSTDIESKIKQLAIPNALLEIQIDKKAPDKILMSELEKYFSDTGQDSIEILFSANPGSPALPLKAIASGGELSRMLLAAKKALSDVLQPRTIILDEIDTGIGGKTAGYLADFIHTLAARHQVICITHLAKIAARADTHFCIEKRADVQTTEVTVELLSTVNRIKEIARMLSGQITDLSLKHAKELLLIDER